MTFDSCLHISSEISVDGHRRASASNAMHSEMDHGKSRSYSRIFLV